MNSHDVLQANNLRLFYILLVCLINCIPGYTQEKHDYVWVLGGGSALHGSVMDFNATPVNVEFRDRGLWMSGANTGICNDEGRLLFYSNGCHIANREHRIMDNGDDINPGIVYEDFCSQNIGQPWTQSAIALTNPGTTDLYFLFHQDIDMVFLDDGTVTLAPLLLYYHIIDMTGDNSLGTVISKNKVVIQDTLGRGNIQAVKHANGTDWWMIVPKWNTNCYFLILITPGGLQEPLIKCAGASWGNSDGGQAVFSPDGSKYLRFNYQNGLHIYDFDTNTGELSNARILEFPDDPFPINSGISVSPSSQYAYASTRQRLYQIDLQAEDMAASYVVVAELDQVNTPYAPNFDKSALAPDGKIYIVGSGGSMLLHIIHRPDCPGELCYVEQRALEMPVFNYRSIPNIPHYRNEPSGDDCEPIVSNSEEAWSFKSIEVYPVPATDHINIIVPKESGVVTFELYDLTGRIVLRSALFSEQTNVALPSLASGMYFYRIISSKYDFHKTGKLPITGR